jgi:hypothetical protein
MRFEECRLLGYKTPVRTSQETYYFSVRERELMLYKIGGFHGDEYGECRIWDIETQFVPHRRQITSSLQSPAS